MIVISNLNYGKPVSSKSLEFGAWNLVITRIVAVDS